MAEDANGVAVSAEGRLPLRVSENIQGNILAPFNKPYQRFLFIGFRNRRAEARYWLAQLVGAVASTRQVVDHGDARRRAKDEGTVSQQWVGVSFTSSGLVVLDSDLAKDLVAFDAFWQGPIVDRKFSEARTMSPAVVGDVVRGDPRKWVVGGPGQYPVDALLTVAADDPDKLEAAAKYECDRAVECGLKVLSWQDCQRLRGEKGDLEGNNKHGIEPFGFRDGISQPGIRGFTEPTVHNERLDAADQLGTPIIATGEFVLGYDGEGGSYPDVTRSRLPEWMRDGSFQVCLRLRQDVDGWQTKMDEPAGPFGGISAATVAIGRTSEGEALAAPGEGGEYNDFTFENDLWGEQTPRFAHIRKMNPRNGTFDDRTHRLLRRGIPFAAPLNVETPLPGHDDVAAGGDEVGLVFNAFMASIENQFEFLQRSWASNPCSLPPVAADGPDPLVGASNAPNILRREGAEVEIHFDRFVWTSGAVYAFAPSLPALRLLAAPKGA